MFTSLSEILELAVGVDDDEDNFVGDVFIYLANGQVWSGESRPADGKVVWAQVDYGEQLH